MEGLNPVLVLDGESTLRIEYISNDSIPGVLNGESGFHVYHVRMLTELILKQLINTGGAPFLSEEDVNAISIASSLHDIGKMRIPKSILDFPGKLSPVEYDIVKKHALLGEEIIASIKTDIDPTIIKYAKEIARCHHERYDGTGYPDALCGDDIPLCAQAVSLADAFDALTSARSYKQAFSQDVAIEMITNGMCGVFNPALIDCLLSVVNNKVLVGIREQLQNTRSVIAGQNVFTPKRVLIAGNTGYITKDFVDEAFYAGSVMIVGESTLKSTNRIKVYNIKAPSYEDIFDTYDFDVVIYLAAELSYDCAQRSDAEELRSVLEQAAKKGTDTRFLYISSLDSAFNEKSGRAVLSRSKESLCEYYHDEFCLDIKIIRIPYLYSSLKKDDFLHRIFEQMEKEGTVTLNENAASRCYFLSSQDLCELVVRLLDNWREGIGILNINDEFNITFNDLAEKVAALKGGVKVDFTGEAASKTLDTNNKALRNEYGWFSKISILEELDEQYGEFLGGGTIKSDNLLDTVRLWMHSHKAAAKTAEMLLLFIITEILMRLTDSAVLFSIVDFRMAFVVIMATLHGLPFGIASAALSSFSWLIAKVLSGTRLLTIFYEPSNWLAFVYFFLIGALCGYIRLKNDDAQTFLKEQNDLVEEKLLFTREIYNDTFREKRDLKKQIIGSKDSFGKIFDITKRLDTVEPRELYLRIMETFESILENKSISVYSVNENSAFGRLEVASRDIIDNAARSISLDTFSPVIKSLEADEIWRNTSLTPGLPMYAAGVYRSGKIELLIFLWHTGEAQRSLYYVNLFKILRDLVQMSLLRAYDYNQAIYEKQYVEGTRILNAEAFGKVLESFKSMADRKVSSYVLLGIDCRGKSYKEMDALLSKRIRTNDILGASEDGRLQLLLSQATERDLSFILPRFENLDIEVSVLAQ